MEIRLLFAVISGVAILLLLIIRFRLQAFVGLLLTSIYVGLVAGIPGDAVIQSIQKGMGDTLGFVAVVVGLGAIFGAILENSGGAERIASALVARFGMKKAPEAMLLTGFIISIPVFFDVAFIIMIPLIYRLSADSKRSVLLFGLPLLAGLTITHAFIPPTPGPVAVADILNADLGWVILAGVLCGIPTAILTGQFLSRYLANKYFVQVPPYFDQDVGEKLALRPALVTVLMAIGIPILMILMRTILSVLRADQVISGSGVDILIFIGHPFVALTVGLLYALWFLGIRQGINSRKLLDIATESLKPAGIIILVTGAGGIFKQVLIDSGIGDMVAESVASAQIPVLLLSFVIAALVRITQGSATVAMITSAGITAPIIAGMDLSGLQQALLVISIASGASTLSHVNDSGFWLVNRYFAISETLTFRTWTVLTLAISLAGLLFSALLWWIF